jgi:hypothetical protein
MKTTTFYILALTMLMASCGQEPTLQKYFVESSDDKGFMVLDIAPTIIQTDKIKLTEEEKVALNSLDKFNILAYTTDKNNPAKLKQEQEKVKQLLKGEEYEETDAYRIKRAGSLNTYNR